MTAKDDYVALLGQERVLDAAVTLDLYSYDASMETGRPDLVVIPRNTTDLAPIVGIAIRHGLPYVMRGAGTGYSGGALAAHGGVVILTRDLTSILEIDEERRLARCEPGVVLADLQDRVACLGLRYLPDPSSHRVCTIGGNVAENAGGPHAFGHGPTSNFVAAMDVVLPDGSLTTLHEDDVFRGGLDLRSLMVGSEGTLGVITAVTLRLVPQPQAQRVIVASFTHQDDAVDALERLFAEGVTPTALDMLTGAYMPGEGETDDPSVLFIDVEGSHDEVDQQCRTIAAVAADSFGTTESLRVEEFLRVRADLVKAKVRRMIDRSGLPRYYLFDCVAPRARLRDLMRVLREASERYGLPLLNTFHAGDGNVHPAPFYDPDAPDHEQRLREFLAEVLTKCAELGGTVSGEHGIGLEKRELMPLFHDASELAAMAAVKQSFDPAGLCNPGKILPPERREPSRRQRVRVDSRVVVEWGNGTIGIGAEDVTFAECAQVLAGSRFELAYEPVGASPGSRVLAALDLGLPGVREPYRLRARDQIVACTLTGDDNEVRTFGGLCAKDVSGYELRKLAFGGRGRLGRLTSVVMRLTAAPVARHAIEVGGLDDFSALAKALNGSSLPIASLALTGFNGRQAMVVLLETQGGDLKREVEHLLDQVAAAGGTAGSPLISRFGWWERLPIGTTAYHRGHPTPPPDGTFCALPGQDALWSAGSAGKLVDAALAERTGHLVQSMRRS